MPGGASARQWRAPSARAPSRAQAELSNAADGEQERNRGYLLQRLLPAMASYYSKVDFDAAGDPTGPLLAPEVVMQRQSALTTVQLERRLAHVYRSLLAVCTACVPGTSAWVALAQVLLMHYNTVA